MDGKEYHQVDTVGGDITGYKDTELAPEKSYHYRIIAFNEIGDSDYSNQVMETTYDFLPEAPSNPEAVAVSSSNIDLMWTDNSTNELGFKIERSENGEDFTEIDKIGPDITTYSDTGLKKAKQYYYRVCTYNNTGNSPYSLVADVATFDEIPALPSNLRATAVSANGVELAWDDNSDNEDGFVLTRRKKYGDPSQYNDVKITKGTTSFTDSGLDPATIYNYSIRAYNAVGYSEYSNMISAATRSASGQVVHEQNAVIQKQGGIVKVSDPESPVHGAVVEIPEGALNETVTISISQIDNSSYPGIEDLIVDFKPSGIQFKKPVKIGVPYTKDNIDNPVVYRYNKSKSRWMPLNTTLVDKINKIAWAETTHFSQYTTYGYVNSPSFLKAKPFSYLDSEIQLEWLWNYSQYGDYYWTKNIYFVVFRSTDGISFTPIAIVRSYEPSYPYLRSLYNDDRLNESTTYYYRVAANVNTFSSYPSSIARATTKTCYGAGENILINQEVDRMDEKMVKVFDTTLDILKNPRPNVDTMDYDSEKTYNANPDNLTWALTPAMEALMTMFRVTGDTYYLKELIHFALSAVFITRDDICSLPSSGSTTGYLDYRKILGPVWTISRDYTSNQPYAYICNVNTLYPIADFSQLIIKNRDLQEIEYSLSCYEEHKTMRCLYGMDMDGNKRDENGNNIPNSPPFEKGENFEKVTNGKFTFLEIANIFIKEIEKTIAYHDKDLFSKDELNELFSGFPYNYKYPGTNNHVEIYPAGDNSYVDTLESQWDQTEKVYRFRNCEYLNGEGGGSPNQILPFNMQHIMGRTLLMLYLATGKEKYKQRVAEIANRFIVENKFAEQRAQECYIWAYVHEATIDELDPKGKKGKYPYGNPSDIGHAETDLAFAYMCYENCIAFDESDMKCFANTFSKKIFKERFDLNDFVDGQEHQEICWQKDGSGTPIYDSEGVQVMREHYEISMLPAYIKLAKFNNEIYKACLDFYLDRIYFPTLPEPHGLDLLGIANLFDYIPNPSYGFPKVIVSGDFNNDKKDDICAFMHHGGGDYGAITRIHTWLSDGNLFRYSGKIYAKDKNHTIYRRKGFRGWWASDIDIKGSYDADLVIGRVVSGDFTGNGYSDIAAFYDDNSSGGSGTSMQVWTTGPKIFRDVDSRCNIIDMIHPANSFGYSGGKGWWKGTVYGAKLITNRVVCGNFVGASDSVDEIAAFYNVNGSGKETELEVFISEGTYFYSPLKATLPFNANNITGRVVAGNFDGIPGDEIAAFYNDCSGTSLKVWKVKYFYNSDTKRYEISIIECTWWPPN